MTSAVYYPCSACHRIAAVHQCDTGAHGCMHCNRCGCGEGPGAPMSGADISPTKYFARAGYRITDTCGGNVAWLRVLADGTHVLVTDDDDPGALPEMLSADVMVGLYPDGDYASPGDIKTLRCIDYLATEHATP